MSSDDILSESDVLVPNVEIDFSREMGEPNKNGKILRIGRFKELNNHNIRKQITEACRELEFEYIHFEQFFLVKDQSFKDSILYEVTDLYTNLEFIRKLNLKPIVKLDLDSIEKFNGERYEILEYIEKGIRNRLDFIQKKNGLEYLSTWSFEISSDNTQNEVEYLKILGSIFKEYSNEIKIGISLSDNLLLEDDDKTLLKAMNDNDTQPDFVTFESDPNKSNLSIDIDETNSSTFENYLKSQIVGLKRILEENNLNNALIFVTSFNTLGGAGYELAGSFFRAALILNTILSIDLPYVNLSYWVSNQAYENTKPGIVAEYRSLSLFVIGLVKRPAYFVLQLIDKAGNNLRTIRL